MSRPGNLWRKVHGRITKKPTNFSWLINDKLAGSGMPTSHEEVEWVIKTGVKSVVTMTEEPLPESWIKNIKYLHVPTEDLSAPDMDKINDTVDYIHERIQNNEPTMIHCAAGIGRTGTILACYLIKYHKLSTEEAISRVRKERPGSVQSESQEIAIELFHKFINK
ncbi:MAG: dual specificity protein phosphatase 23 [Nitrosopumilaceae archaeon]